jgi:hypothetical protein
MRKPILYLLISCLFLSFTSNIQRKVFRSGDYDIVCYVSSEPLEKFKLGLLYHWYKAGKIHVSQSEAGGAVLHEEYQKFYRSGQLAESGNFYYGLKDGEWRSWFENGIVETSQHWKHGVKDGWFKLYNTSGDLVESGLYKNNKKHKLWIHHINKDTLYFKSDSVYNQKPIKSSFFNRIFKKRDSVQKAERRLQQELKRESDSIKRIERKHNKKD